MPKKILTSIHRRYTTEITSVNPSVVIIRPGLIWIGMSHSVLTDSLCYSSVVSVVLWPVLHVMVAGIVHTARSWLTDLDAVSSKSSR